MTHSPGSSHTANRWQRHGSHRAQVVDNQLCGARTGFACLARISGFRNETDIAVLKLKGHIVEVTRLAWRTYSPGADKNGTRFTLKVLKGERVLFEAKREGASSSQNFGAGEMYLGTTHESEGEWVVVKGKLPERLVPK